MHLLEIHFDNDFNYNMKMEDINDFLDNNDFDYIKDYIRTINLKQKESRKYIREHSKLFKKKSSSPKEIPSDEQSGRNLVFKRKQRRKNTVKMNKKNKKLHQVSQNK